MPRTASRVAFAGRALIEGRCKLYVRTKPMFQTSVMVTLLFLTASGAADKSLPQMRMTPVEIQASTVEDNQTGGSGVAGGHRKVLFGDPMKPGFYSILLFVPAQATIQAHSHRDDR